jgi:phosphorylcholine metabolism protein LicD
MLNTEVAIKNLKDLDNICRKNNRNCWIQDGTLLGYYRENNFIDHDLDTDMGMMYKDLSIKILEEAKEIGFEYRFIGFIDECGQLVFKRNGVKTDIFLYYTKKNQDIIYHSAYTTINKIDRRIDYYYEKFNTKEINFLGCNLLVPSDELKFIITKYGENWNIPDKNWDYAFSPKNHQTSDMIIKEPEYSKEYWVRYHKWHDEQYKINNNI